MSKILCFKQTRNMHESGYRYIEYGYMSENDGEEVIDIVGRYDLLQTPYDIAIPCNIDLTKSGWFRILPRMNREIEWAYGGTIAVKGIVMNCTHAGFVHFDNNTEEWYCRRCGDTTDQPADWSQEEIEEEMA